MKRAFTLIELLVVIAIIAILAAILFPVFAQAKEAAKKTQTLSNTKQTATSILIYTTDSDDVFPISNSIDDGGGCGYGAGNAGQLLTQGWAATTPSGADDPSCDKIDQVAWVNSTHAYRKSYDLMTQAGAQQFDTYVASYMATFVKAPALSSLAMNGLLTEYSATAVANPSKNPLIWPGSYKYNWRGALAIPANPSLFCGAPGAGGATCKFSAASPPSSFGWNAANNGDQFWRFTNLNSTLWMYGKGFNYAATDSSAKFVVQGNGGSHNGPALTLNSAGVLASVLRCTTTGAANGYYVSWFRPDSQYNYPTNATSLACGW
jgi:prepilin-type N-terminal cleavage/methylation domain-containing protein